MSGALYVGTQKVGPILNGILPTGTMNITSNNTYDVTNYQYANVNIPAIVPVIESLGITPTTSSQTITATGGVDGYSPITVNAVTSSIDANITAGNIKKNVTILGVTGTYEASLPDYIPWKTPVGGVYRIDDSQTTFHTSTASIIGAYQLAGAFAGSHLTSASLTNIVQVRDFGLFHTFGGSNYLTSVDVSKIATVGVNGMQECFQSCPLLTTMNFAALTKVSQLGFYRGLQWCIGLTTASFPLLNEVEPEAFFAGFSGCTSLTNASFPSLTDTSAVGTSRAFAQCFADCTGIVNFTGFGNLEIVGDNTFHSTFAGCSNMANIDLSKVSEVGTSGFQNCFNGTKIEYITFNSLQTIGAHGFEEAFKNCSRISIISFPSLTTVDSSAFHNMLAGCIVVEVHFPSNLQSTMSSWSDVIAGFGGTSVSIVFDLPATA